MSHGTLDRLRAGRDGAVAVLFGDSAGLTLYLASMLFFVLTWRVGTFFNDVGLFVPALERLAAGHLSLGTPAEVEHLYPGMSLVDGRVYARNFGELVLSLPAYWVVDLLGPVAVRALVVAGWSLLALVVAVRIADRYGRRRLGLAVGATVAVGALLANAATFRPFVEAQTAIVALQLTTMLVAGFTGVLVYRLIARDAGTRVGVLAGAVTAFATPVGFWATIPKRHAFTATLVLAALYGLARSRREPAPSARLGSAGFRALAYASAGLLAWIHAPEGFTLFLAVALVDIPTAPRNDRRTLAIVGGAFLLSLVPFFLTNHAISGNPLDPPRFYQAFRGTESIPVAGSDGGGGGAVGGDGGGGAVDGSGGAVGGTGGPLGGAGSPLVVALESVFPATFVSLIRRGLLRYLDGGILVLTNPGRLGTLFLRWGRQGYDPGNIFFGNGTNLAVVEAAPVLAALAVAPVRRAVVAVRERAPPAVPRAVRSVRPTDAFVLVASVLFVTLYIANLPVRVQVTVRYLHPIYPLLVYALFRQAWLRELLDAHTEYALWGYEAAVLLGVPLSVLLLLVTDVSKGRVLQAFGPLALVVAGLLVVSALVAGTSRGSVAERAARSSALYFGLAAGAGTALLLLSAFVLMHYGPSALPAVDAVTAEVRFAVVRFG